MRDKRIINTELVSFPNPSAGVRQTIIMPELSTNSKIDAGRPLAKFSQLSHYT